MKQVLIIGLFIVLCAAGLYGGIQGAQYLTKPHSDNADCTSLGQNHTVVFAEAQVQPSQINAKRCDTMTIQSTSMKNRLIAFGVHNQHKAYNGITEQQLRANDSFTVTLTTTGSFLFHDHQQETLGATFLVTD